MCRNACRNPLDYCPACEAERLLHLEAAREFDLLCESDPRLDPSHRYATDDEYRAYVESITLPARPAHAA